MYMRREHRAPDEPAMAEENKLSGAQNGKKPAKQGPRRPWALFKTINARVNFVIVATGVMIAGVASYGMVELWNAGRADDIQANERYAAAAVAPAAIAVNDIQGLLTDLGDSYVRMGSKPENCAGLTAAALAKFSFVRVGLAAPSGQIICESPAVGEAPALAPAAAPGQPQPDVSAPPAAAQNVSGETYFQRAVENGKFAIGDAVESGRAARLGFAFAAKESDRTAAVAFGVIDSSLLGSGLYPRYGYAVGIADDRGATVIRRSEANPTGGTAAVLPAQLVTEMLSRKTGSAEITDPDGTKRVYSFDSTKSTIAGRLYFYAGGPTPIVFAETQSILDRLILITALSAAILLWLMLALGDFLISRRARRLAHVLLATAGGEASPEKMPAGLGEFDGFIGLFDRVSSDLKAARASTEMEVKTRTSSLVLSKGLTELEKARTEALLASIGEGVVATDKEGRVSFINDVAKRALWWNPEKVMEIPVHSAFRLEDDKENYIDDDRWPTGQAMAERKTVITPAPVKPFFLRRKDNTKFPVRLTVSPVVLDGEVVGSLVIFADITDEVEFDRRKSEFISVASHQLRSPTSAIKWMTDMLRKGDFGAMSEKQLEWVNKLYASSEQLVELINQLLNISRLEAGVKMAPVETDTAAYIQDVLKQTEPWFQEKQQKLAYDPTPLPKLVFDPMMMGEVLKNLLSNASKYSPPGSTIRVTAAHSDTDVQISVADQGLGIPKSDYNQMFNKFFRAENVVSSEIRGTGLGLYYCKSAVEAHGGKIGFESTEGKGSTVWFTLPVKGPPAAK